MDRMTNMSYADRTRSLLQNGMAVINSKVAAVCTTAQSSYRIMAATTIRSKEFSVVSSLDHEVICKLGRITFVLFVQMAIICSL